MMSCDVNLLISKPLSLTSFMFTGYSWTPDWDPAKGNDGNAADGNAANGNAANGNAADRSSYVRVLVVRPIALIATFIAAYAVRHFYPDVFCYE